MYKFRNLWHFKFRRRVNEGGLIQMRIAGPRLRNANRTMVSEKREIGACGGLFAGQCAPVWGIQEECSGKAFSTPINHMRKEICDAIRTSGKR